MPRSFSSGTYADNLNTHVSAAMRRFIEAHPDWLTEVRLPGYAPELNPSKVPGRT